MTSHRKILIGCPAKSGLRGDFATRMLDMLRRPECARMDFVVGEDASVAQCRNEFAHLAVECGYEALVMIDQDLRWNEADFFRLIGNALPFVAGIYCKKYGGEPYWLFHPWRGTYNGLPVVRCSAMAIGFSFITTETLKMIRSATPELAFHQAWPPEQSAALRHDWFPVGVVDKHYVQEDYGFCRLATRAGVGLFADTSLVIPHIGAADYPADVGAAIKLPEPDPFYER